MVCVCGRCSQEKSGMNTMRAYRIHVGTYYLHCELGIHDSREIATRGTSSDTYTHFPE